MKETKFKFWSKFLDAFCIPDDDIFVGTLKDKNMIVLQYIGIKDKNGKEIYEGDIVKRNDGNKEQRKERHVVKFTVNDGYNSYFDPMFMDLKKSEVIGNIYEDPELVPNNGGASL